MALAALAADSDALIRSAGADSTVAPIGAPPPLIFLEANVFVQWLAKPRAQKTRRENEIAHARHCERSEAIQGRVHRLLDCFVAELVIGPATSGRTRWLLAMTAFLSTPRAKRGEDEGGTIAAVCVYGSRPQKGSDRRAGA